jgi:hypothetical protein
VIFPDHFQIAPCAIGTKLVLLLRYASTILLRPGGDWAGDSLDSYALKTRQSICGTALWNASLDLKAESGGSRGAFQDWVNGANNPVRTGFTGPIPPGHYLACAGTR